LRDEQKRFGDTQLFPEQDEAGDTAAVKQVRAAIRALLAQVAKNSAVRAKALHAKYDQALAQAQTQLTQLQRLDDALLVKAKRAEVAAAWIAPAVADISQKTPAANTVPKTPPGAKPTVGTPMSEKGAFGKSGTKAGGWDDAVAQRIKAALDNHVTERHGPAGPKGNGKTEMPQEGAVLVGFEYVNGSWKGDPMVKSLRPLFLNANGVVPGGTRGNSNQAYKVIKAREGFAVSGLIVNPGLERLGGFQVVFAKMQGQPVGSGKVDTYKSGWIGGELKKGSVVLGGDGKLGIGIFGVSGADVESIGLIVAP
jgi:hypothetical protein